MKAKKELQLFPNHLYVTRYKAGADMLIHETSLDAVSHRSSGEMTGVIGVYRLEHVADVTLTPRKPSKTGR